MSFLSSRVAQLLAARQLKNWSANLRNQINNRSIVHIYILQASRFIAIRQPRSPSTRESEGARVRESSEKQATSLRVVTQLPLFLVIQFLLHFLCQCALFSRHQSYSSQFIQTQLNSTQLNLTQLACCMNWLEFVLANKSHINI